VNSTEVSGNTVCAESISYTLTLPTAMSRSWVHFPWGTYWWMHTGSTARHFCKNSKWG